MDAKKALTFIKNVPANNTVTLTKDIVTDGTVEEIALKFYAGQEKQLQVYPVIVHKGGVRENILDYAIDGEQFISGDDDNFKFPVVIPVRAGDYVEIKAINNDLVYDYTLSCFISVDYYAGMKRVIGGVVNG